MSAEQLKLDNQICFPLYAASRLITNEYKPLLKELGITYPQYLVMLVLWEEDGVTVNSIGKKLILNTNTLTPLLKRLEALDLLIKKRSEEDERKVFIYLTKKGEAMQTKAECIPLQLLEGLNDIDLSLEDLMDMKKKLDTIINHLLEK